jgi:hypothetical protein
VEIARNARWLTLRQFVFEVVRESNRRSRVSEELADRMLGSSDSHVRKRGRTIARCASNGRGRRCGTSLCPRCARRMAMRRRRAVERAILERRGAVIFATLTVRAPSIARGRTELVGQASAFAGLRRRESWDPVMAARGQVEAVPSVNGGWCVHAHVLLSVCGDVQVDAIKTDWSELLGELSGTLDVRAVTRKWVTGEDGECFRADGVLRDEAAAVGAARVERRRAHRVLPRALREALGAELRAGGR